VSRADAATLLERARALLASDSHRDGSDVSDEWASADATSVALIASVAAPAGPVDPGSASFEAVLDDYRAGAAGLALRTGFAGWAAAAGLTYVCRHGIAVALDASGRVVAAVDTNPHDSRPPTRRPRSRGGGVHRVHTHGFARVEGTWTCVQDYYAAGEAPESGCGRTWDEAGRL
jgi:hypothetical protein